ncbi:hypothetical protein M0R45_026212 [Rubus argutus]|uniref:Uncharacterized protein n=1 Tax=Rubus argutus TaxID=59490 RepID=A0AAW1WYN3_RUBAR
MAPQVTVFFHKLPATSTKRTSHRISFVIGYAPTICAMSKPSLGGRQGKAATKHQSSQESTKTSQQTTIEGVDQKKIAEEIVKSLQTPQKLPGRPKGSKNKENPVFRDDSYSGPITRTQAHKMSCEMSENTSSVDGTSWNENPLF